MQFDTPYENQCFCCRQYSNRSLLTLIVREDLKEKHDFRKNKNENNNKEK